MTGLHKRINSRLDKAIWEYHMLSDGDCILFAVSGGADSMALVKLLHQRIHIFAKALRLHALYVDLGFDGSQEERCKHMNDYFQSLEIKATTLKTRIGPDAHRGSKKVNPCFLCSRIRRKHIFKTAEELNCNKIVFGHHKDDLIQTLILNMIFGREISTMTPKLEVFKGKFTLLRPMAFIDEPMIKHFIEQQNIPVIEQNCPTDGNSEREYIKSIVYQLERKFRGARNNIFYSMKNVKTDYLL